MNELQIVVSGLVRFGGYVFNEFCVQLQSCVEGLRTRREPGVEINVALRRRSNF